MSRRLALSGFLIPLVLAVTAAAQGTPATDPLAKFIRGYVSEPGNMSEEDIELGRYASAIVDLNGDAIPEWIVYLSIPSYCGSGGCVTLVLEPAGDSWQVITLMTITRLPIRVLTSVSRGWHDLGVSVGGGGIIPAYESWIRFNGQKYPSNPSVTGRVSAAAGTFAEGIPATPKWKHLYRASNPDELVYASCLGKAETQQALHECASEEASRLDRDLNTVYQQVLKAAADDSLAVQGITNQQRTWIAWRDSYLNAIFPHKAEPGYYGSIMPTEANQYRAEVTRRQIEALKALLLRYAPR